jgi:hypothetical protein
MMIPITISLSETIYNKIKKRATAKANSFASEARTLILYGLRELEKIEGDNKKWDGTKT